MGKRHSRVALAGLLVALAAAVAPAAEIEWQVRHGAGGIHRLGRAIPASVTVENATARDRTVRVEAGLGPAILTQRVELPAGTRKKFTLYIAPSGFDRSYPLRLIDANGAVLKEFQLTSRPLVEGQVAVGVVGGHALGWDGLDSRDRRLRVFQLAYLHPSDLSGIAEGLRSLDVLAWIDPRPADLRPEQIDAVAQWTEEGGRLVLVVDDVWMEAAAGALEPWTRQRPRDPVPVRSLRSTAEAAGVPGAVFPEALPVSVLDPRGGEAWLVEPFGPVAAVETRGRGSVTMIGFDPSEPPLSAWTGWPAFWRAWLKRVGLEAPEWLEPPQQTQQQRLAGQTTLNLWRSAHDLLTREQEIEAPPVTLLLVLFAVYLLLIGPVDYLLLRRFGRPTWTWITLPALVALVSLGTYAVAATARAARPQVNHVLLRDLHPEAGRVSETLLASLFVDRHGAYELRSLESNRIALPLTGYGLYRTMYRRTVMGEQERIFRQSPPSATGRVPKWGFLSAMFVGRDAARGARVDADLAVVEGKLRGTVRPALGTDLETAWLLLDEDRVPRVFTLGRLPDAVETAVPDVEGSEIDPEKFWVSSLLGARHGSNFASVLLTTTARRAWVSTQPRGAVNWKRRTAASATLPDPHPHLDWSGWLEAGGAVLIGQAGDPARRVEVSVDAPHEGVAFYRVPLRPEAIRR